MVIGGLVLLITQLIPIIKQLKLLAQWDFLLMLLLIIIIGTAAFSLFLGSMKYISPIEASILSSFEPLTAIVISVIWFGQALGLWQFVGAITMILGVTWISIVGSKVDRGGEQS